MNTTLRSLVVSVPLAAATVLMAPGLAQADGNGTITIQPQGPDPKPFEFTAPTPSPTPDPTQPAGPADLSIGKPKPTHPNPQHPTGSDSLAQPTPGPTQPHDGPGDLTSNPGCTHGCGGDGPGDEGVPTPGDDKPEVPGDDSPKGNDDGPSVAVPTRIDAGFDAGSASTSEDAGLDLSFVLIGGALVTATGAAFAARARSRQGA